LTLFESNAQAASQKSRQYQFDADSTKLTGAVANSDTLFQAVQDLSRLVAALLQHPLNHLIWMQIETLVQYLILVPLSFKFGVGVSVGDETLDLDDGLDYDLDLMNQLNFDPSVAIIERAAEYWFDYDTDVLPSTHIVEVLGLHKLANGSLAENVYDLKHCRTEALLPTINIQRIIPYRAGTDHLLLDLDKPSAPI